MLRRLTALALLIAASAAFTTTAQAQGLVTHPKCHALRCIASSQKENLSHARYVCNHGRHASKRWACAAQKWLGREYHQTYVALHPRPVSTGHYAGWSCITNGATPTSAHEGNGYNGSYSGPLGMTTPWAGHYPPGSDWVHSDRSSVYAIAEEEASKHGWNYSWMAGQWPNTFPPCAGFFH
jgi:hypothetical protein